MKRAAIVLAAALAGCAPIPKHQESITIAVDESALERAHQPRHVPKPLQLVQRILRACQTEDRGEPCESPFTITHYSDNSRVYGRRQLGLPAHIDVQAVATIGNRRYVVEFRGVDPREHAGYYGHISQRIRLTVIDIETATITHHFVDWEGDASCESGWTPTASLDTYLNKGGDGAVQAEYLNTIEFLLPLCPEHR